MEQIKIALVEIGDSHDECMFAQLNALQSIHVKIYLIAHKNVAKRLSEQYDFKEVLIIETTGSAFGDLKKMKQISCFLKEHSIKKVVFNTAQGGHIRNLRFMISKNIECYGIIHTIKKFNQSKTQRVIHKLIKRYAVLSDILVEGINTEFKTKVASYYPIEFPEFGSYFEKTKDEIWITIPGGIESRRKDLSALPKMIEQTPDNVKFIFAGKSDLSRPELQELLKQLNKNGLISKIKYFEEHLSNESFYQIIHSSDLLMPLIHPNTPSAEEYPYNQISGSFNLAFGFRKPLLMHLAFSHLEDLRLSANFYEIESFGEDLQLALQNSTNKIAEITEQEKWDISFQRTNYLRFLELI